MRSLSQLLRSAFRPVFGPKRSSRRLRALQTEQLEPRIVLSAILLDIPGIDGDAIVAGATPTDMELESFKWGFARDTTGARASLTDPIKFSDLTFQRTTDSASNDLFAQAALQTLDAKPGKLRLVDNGVNLLRFDLSNSRLTKFSTQNNQTEAGAISFSNVPFTESLATTQRTASWNLLNGAVSSTAIVGQNTIDPTSNSLNIETVMEIGGQKM
jgi:type VI protein secretion system component Hcp